MNRLLVKLLEQDAGHMCLDQLDLDHVDHYCLPLGPECLNLIGYNQINDHVCVYYACVLIG